MSAFFEELGTLDHLVSTAHESSAGIGAMRPFPELEIAAARRFMDGKFWSQVIAARYAVSPLSPQGSITLFSGVASRKAKPRHTSVNGAVDAFARALAHEIRPRRVNVVAPELTATFRPTTRCPTRIARPVRGARVATCRWDAWVRPRTSRRRSCT